MAKAAAGKTFVAVDLVSEEVVALSIFDDRIRDAYVLSGKISDDHTSVVLDRDDSYNGRRATSIAVASENVGLGWRFTR